MIRRPAAILGLLTALNLLNYLDRLVLSAVLSQVQDDLHLNFRTGGALATVFLIGYFATSPIFGSMADRAGRGGRKRLVALGIAVWSLGTVASGLSRSVAGLFAARAFVGVGEASYATIAPTLIDDVAPRARRGRWMAIFYAATPIGSALGYVIGGAVSHALGWRAAFFVAGIPGLLAGLACLAIDEPERHAAGDAAEGRPEALRSLATLSRLPLYVWTVLGYCAYSFAIGGFAHWAPTYLHVRYGADAGPAAATFGAITVVGGAIGTFLGGWLGDRAGRAERDDAATARHNVLVCAVSTGLGAPLAAAAISAGTTGWFYALLLPCEIALFVGSGPINVALLRSVPPALRASAMALSIFAIHALGDLWSPPLIGVVADHAPMQLAMYACPAFFALAALLWTQASRTQAGPAEASPGTGRSEALPSNGAGPTAALPSNDAGTTNPG